MAVAVAVARAWGLPCPEGRTWGDGGKTLEVHHLDSDPKNNNADNLVILDVTAHRTADAQLRTARKMTQGALAELQRAARGELSEMADRLVAGTATPADVLRSAEGIVSRRREVLEGAKKKVKKTSGKA